MHRDRFVDLPLENIVWTDFKWWNTFFSCLLLWTLLMRTEFLASQKMTTAKEAFFKQSNGWVSKSNGDIATCQQFYHKNVFINFSGHEQFFFYLPKTIESGYLCGTLSNIRNGTNSNGKNLCENRSNLVEKKNHKLSKVLYWGILPDAFANRCHSNVDAISSDWRANTLVLVLHPHPFCHTNISIKMFVLCCTTDTHLIINNFNTLLTICEEHRNNNNNNKKNSDWTTAAAAVTIVMIRDYCLKTACETWNFSFGAAFSLYFRALTRYYYNM